MPSSRIQISVLFAALLAVLAGCGREVPPKVEAVRPVRSLEVRPTAIDAGIELPAELRPRIETRYGFRIGGKVAERRVSVGDRVTPGQVLARLDPQDVDPAIASARAALDASRTDASLAATELKRLTDLRARNFVSEASLDRQKAVADAALARVESAEAQLRQARNASDFQTLRADAAGVVVGVDAEAGQVVAAGQSIIRVARAGEIEALINVPEADLRAAREAAHWKVVVPAAGDRVLQGRVREIAPLADPGSRTWAVRLSLTGALDGVALGMTATASTRSAKGEAIVIPITALFSTDAQPKVWVVDPAAGTVRAVTVTTAGLSGENVRIASGLKPGDRVVTAGASLLSEGARVRLLDAAGADR